MQGVGDGFAGAAASEEAVFGAEEGGEAQARVAEELGGVASIREAAGGMGAMPGRTPEKWFMRERIAKGGADVNSGGNRIARGGQKTDKLRDEKGTAEAEQC